MDVTDLHKKFAIVLGMPWLRIYNPHVDWTNGRIEISDKGEFLMAGITSDDNLEEAIPKKLHEFLDVFSEQEARELPPHRDWDMKIDLILGSRQTTE